MDNGQLPVPDCETKESAMVYLVGAGPGDPGLITVKALDILRRADVVMYDKLVEPSLLFETRADCLLIDVGKRTGDHTKTQREITELLIRHGRASETVVRLKGGDPFLFGRGAEEAEHLAQEEIPFAVIPGVSALNAVTTYAGIPITHRDFSSSFGVATGHAAQGKDQDPVKWERLARGVDTVVVFMGVGSLERIVKGMLDGGFPPDTPAALVENGCMPTQRVVTATAGTIVETALREGISPPTLFVTGRSVELHDRLAWYRPGPLAGIRIGVTRPFARSRSFAEKLRALGALPVFMPTIMTVGTTGTPKVQEAMNRLESYDCIVFSSTNGVDFFFQALKERDGDARDLAGKTTAAIGPVTGETLEDYGIRADVTAKTFVAEGLLEALQKSETVDGKKFLLVRSDIGRDILPKGLEGAGAEVDQAAFYSTTADILKPAVIETVKAGGIDMITFTSSSTVEGFFSQVSADQLGEKSKSQASAPKQPGRLNSTAEHPTSKRHNIRRMALPKR